MTTCVFVCVSDVVDVDDDQFNWDKWIGTSFLRIINTSVKFSINSTLCVVERKKMATWNVSRISNYYEDDGGDQ